VSEPLQESPPLRAWVLLLGVAGLGVALALSFSPELRPEGLTPPACRTLGCAFLMATWWIGSRLPLAVPSLVPLALFPVYEIADAKQTAAPYADKMVLLLMCGFLLALAVEKWNLHKRIALTVLVALGRGPLRLSFAVMGITAVLSMWISNTATTLMMLPIVLALVAAAHRVNDDAEGNRRFGLILLLGLAWAASIGGMATPVGTPPNLIFQSAYSEAFPTRPELAFVDWMRIAVPVAVTMLALSWLLLNKVLLPLPPGYKLGDREVLCERLTALGPWSAPELRVAVGFGLVALLWVGRKALFLSEVHDSTIAAAMVILFFVAPSGGKEGQSERLLEWKDSVRVPWGLLLLFGGGIALSAGFKTSGLTPWLGDQLAPLTSLPAPLMVAGVCIAVTFLTEVTSNTATTALILPVLAALAKGTDTDPLLLMIPATLAASCAFMLPVATAPNAIVVGTGRVDPGDMARTGLLLNLLGVIPITVFVLLLT
jgi:solute carrier family 13 (sodium-dependent dicarboxylate transporter), member 2/3/5